MDILEISKNIIEIAQGVVIICATVFTAKWTYRTFAYKERISELKKLKETINLYHWKMQIFCAQVRNNQKADKKEIQEKLELAKLHNRLVSLYDLSLFISSEVREKVIKIVGSWITADKMDRLQHRNWHKMSQAEKGKAWKEFDDEYKEVKEIIDKEASKYV